MNFFILATSLKMQATLRTEYSRFSNSYHLRIVVYIDIIEHQNDGDVRFPIIKIFESEIRLRNGSRNKVTPIHQKSYTSLDYKLLIPNNIQNIQIEWRNETGKLIPFTGTGKIVVSLNHFKCRHNTAIKHLNQCRISPDTTDKEAAALEPLLQVLEELLCHWHANFSGPQ